MLINTCIWSGEMLFYIEPPGRESAGHFKASGRVSGGDRVRVVDIYKMSRTESLHCIHLMFALISCQTLISVF